MSFISASLVPKSTLSAVLKHYILTFDKMQGDLTKKMEISGKIWK